MVLNRYIWRELAVASAATVCITLLVFAAHRLERLLEVAAAGKLPSALLLQLTLVVVGSRLDVLLPMACFAGALIALARLRNDAELDAMSALGFGRDRVVRALLLPAMLVALLTAACSFVLAPLLRDAVERTVSAGRAEALVGALSPGRFAGFRSAAAGGGVIMAGGIDAAGVFEDVFVHISAGGGAGQDEQVLRGRTALVETRGDANGAARFLVLRDGRRYSGTPGSAGYSVTRFESHAVRLDLLATPSRGIEPDAVESASLWVGDSGLPRATELGLLQWRISLPIAAVLLLALAVPLTLLTPRRIRFGAVLLGVLLFVIYFNLLSVAQKMVERGDLAPWPGVLWVHVPVLLLVLLPVAGGWRRRASWRRTQVVV